MTGSGSFADPDEAGVPRVPGPPGATRRSFISLTLFTRGRTTIPARPGAPGSEPVRGGNGTRPDSAVNARGVVGRTAPPADTHDAPRTAGAFGGPAAIGLVSAGGT